MNVDATIIAEMPSIFLMVNLVCGRHARDRFVELTRPFKTVTKDGLQYTLHTATGRHEMEKNKDFGGSDKNPEACYQSDLRCQPKQIKRGLI